MGPVRYDAHTHDKPMAMITVIPTAARIFPASRRAPAKASSQSCSTTTYQGVPATGRHAPNTAIPR